MSDRFSDSINKCIKLLDEIDFLLHTVSIHSLSASESFKRAALRSDSYKQIYDAGIETQNFNFMMKDQSFFQFSEKEKEKEARLAFYPNPYNFIGYKKTEMVWLELYDKGDITQVELEQALSEEVINNDIPQIRYDLSLSQYNETYHPAAHFHIGFHTENRWPTKRVLSPFSFFLKILSLYYVDIWKKHGDDPENKTNKFDDIYRKELKQCGNLSEQYFKVKAQERLHIA